MKRLPAIAAAFLAIQSSADGATFEARLEVVDPGAFTTAPLQTETIWLITGPDGQRIERVGEGETARFELPEGRHDFIVWSADRSAATRFQSVVTGAGVNHAALLLNPGDVGYIPDHVVSQPAALPGQEAAAPVAPVLPPAAVSGPAPGADITTAPEPESGPEPESEPEMFVRPEFSPGMRIAVQLPAGGSQWDFVGLTDGKAGYLATIDRGLSDVARFDLPMEPGSYRIDYVEVPGMDIRTSLEVEVK